jgi:hypothetical protein
MGSVSSAFVNGLFLFLKMLNMGHAAARLIEALTAGHVLETSKRQPHILEN